MSAPWAKIIGRILGRVGDRLDAASDTSGDPATPSTVEMGESNEAFTQNIAQEMRDKNPMGPHYDKMNQREMNPGRDKARMPTSKVNDREEKRRQRVLAEIDARQQVNNTALGGPISDDLLNSVEWHE